MGGKTSNLQYIHTQVPKDAKGDLLSIATETERTLFFDFLPLDLGRVRGFQTRFHLYTVPGQVLYERVWLCSMERMGWCLWPIRKSRSSKKISRAYVSWPSISPSRIRVPEFPIILQYNKRDVPGALPVPTLDKVPEFAILAAL